MELNVARAQKRVGEPFPFELDENVGPLSYNGRTVTLSAPLHVQGYYTFDGKGFLVEAEARTVLCQACALCGEAFESAYAFPVNERFFRASESAEEETYPYAGDRLELTQAVMDNFFLSLPLVSVCKPDCRGLCPICGANRNVRDCACQPNRAAGPFAALAEFPHDEE